ncbi:hypothetical protein NDU88_006404 [Pleurodeles waltl]|uniref:Uncharacterized protein n=1 Tax=Pleurodeles waltl TaxID=8319 RepID=A0AAV7QNG7_PLEWA|nr:hypothetical protein NDU88_006404 [Pleurodeles waltl]
MAGYKICVHLAWFNASQDLYDAQFGDGSLGDGEVPGTSKGCGVSGAIAEWELDYEEEEMKEGEIVEERECEWCAATPGGGTHPSTTVHRAPWASYYREREQRSLLPLLGNRHPASPDTRLLPRGVPHWSAQGSAHLLGPEGLLPRCSAPDGGSSQEAGTLRLPRCCVVAASQGPPQRGPDAAR